MKNEPLPWVKHIESRTLICPDSSDAFESRVGFRIAGEMFYGVAIFKRRGKAKAMAEARDSVVRRIEEIAAFAKQHGIAK